jgi:hypothetical protein
MAAFLPRDLYSATVVHNRPWTATRWPPRDVGSVSKSIELLRRGYSNPEDEDFPPPSL